MKSMLDRWEMVETAVVDPALSSDADKDKEKKKDNKGKAKKEDVGEGDEEKKRPVFGEETPRPDDDDFWD